MMQHRMHSFYMKAKQYCCFVKDWVIDEHSAADLTDLLMELYQRAKQLPKGKTLNSEADSADRYPQSAPNIQINADLPYVYQFTEPFGKDSMRMKDQHSLKVDLGDIYEALIPGIHLYETGEQAKACYLWRSSWEIHWGTHAINALQVLHTYLTQPDYLKELKADQEEIP